MWNATFISIAMLACTTTAEFVKTKLKTMGNIMNLELNAQASLDNLYWGIEALNIDDRVRI